MRIRELVELLSQYDEESEVRLMTQKNWPFECSVQGVCSQQELVPESKGEREVVFVVEGATIAYGNKNAWEVT